MMTEIGVRIAWAVSHASRRVCSAIPARTRTGSPGVLPAPAAASLRPPRARRRGRHILPLGGSVRLRPPAPDVAEGHEVLDFVEARIALLELAPNPLYRRSNVGPVAVLPVAADEAAVPYLVIDGAVADILADVAGEKVNDAEFSDRKIYVDVVPEGAADMVLQHKAAAPVAALTHELRSLGLRRDAQPMDQDGDAAGLVDEINRPAVERHGFVDGQRPTRQKDHRHVDAELVHSWQQVDALDMRQVPVEHDDVGVDGNVRVSKQRLAVGEDLYRKAVLFELRRQHLTEECVVIDDNDPQLGIANARRSEERRVGK